MKYANGNIYTGEWSKGSWYNQGKLVVHSTGTVREGYWSFIERRVALTAMPTPKQSLWELTSGSYHMPIEKTERSVYLDGVEIVY